MSDNQLQQKQQGSIRIHVEENKQAEANLFQNDYQKQVENKQVEGNVNQQKNEEKRDEIRASVNKYMPPEYQGGMRPSLMKDVKEVDLLGEKNEEKEEAILDEIVEHRAPKLKGKPKSPAKPEKAGPLSVSESFMTYETLRIDADFAEIQAHDSDRMRAVKEALDNFMALNHNKGFTMVLTKIDALNELISACRWYNATRWSLKGPARARQRQVKSILTAAKKERDRLEKMDSNREKHDAKFEDKASSERLNAASHHRRNIRKQYNALPPEKQAEIDAVLDQKRQTMELDEDDEIAVIAQQINKSNVDLLVNNRSDMYRGESSTSTGSRYWATLKAFTVGLFARNVFNVGMGAVAGAAWLATYPFAALYGAATKQSKYYKGFNIKIPRPMGPKGWYDYYMFRQKHVVPVATDIANGNRSVPMKTLKIIGKFLKINAWYPLKHILTLDMRHLAGDGFIEPHKKENQEKKNAEEYNSVYNEFEEEEIDEKEKDNGE